MQILFESRDPEGAQLRELAIRRAGFVFRRLSQLVSRANVQLSDVNGPRSGVDKRCQVRILTNTGGTVVISAMASDWRSALDSALAGAVRLLMRVRERSRGRNRSRSAWHAEPEEWLGGTDTRDALLTGDMTGQMTPRSWWTRS